MKNKVLLWWRVLMVTGGLAFGLIGDRRPFGESAIAHPLVVYVGIVGAALLILRVALARPVPEVIGERALAIGFVLGLAAFLVGNWLSSRLIGVT
jgi:hypothetical protein